MGSVLDGKYQGCVVNSLHQITSSNPAKFSLSLNKSNETYKGGGGRRQLRGHRAGARHPQVSWWTCSAISPAACVNKYEGFQVETDGAGNPYVNGPRPGPDQL